MTLNGCSRRELAELFVSCFLLLWSLIRLFRTVINVAFSESPNKQAVMALVHFHRAALNAGRSSVLLSVRLSVRSPSVKRVHCDKTEERSVQIFIRYERSLSLVF